MLTISACYFDDFWKLAWKIAADASKTRFNITIRAFGAHVAEEKSKEMYATSRFLGVYTVAQHFAQGEVTTFPAPMTVARMTSAVHYHLATDSMTPAQASKLRGLAQWTDSHVIGRSARARLRLLAERQYGSGTNSPPPCDGRWSTSRTWPAWQSRGITSCSAS